MNLNEQKDLNIYKKLLTILSDYEDKFPATSVGGILKKCLENGLKIIPKDKEAQNILNGLLTKDTSVPAIVQSLLNFRFTDLSIDLQPIYKGENGRRTVAFWSYDDKVYDKVLSLINLDLKAKCFWANAQGEKVELIDINEEKQ